MRIMILGGDGMMGHQLFRHLRGRHEVAVTLRQGRASYASGLFDAENSFTDIDVRMSDHLMEVFAAFRPEVVVNCVGIVKQRPLAHDAIASLEINALLPHRLAVLCRLAGARLVHLSTDCVFRGDRGGYLESDIPDATDLYGRSKLLGEVAEEGCLTLRTSIIGLELARRTSLVEWFLRQSGTVSGYSRAIFSGFTTIELSRIIEMLITRHPEAHGLYQVSSEPIDKLSLLTMLRDMLELPVQIVPDERVAVDRSLDSSRFRSEFSYDPPSWPAMLKELADDYRARQEQASWR